MTESLKWEYICIQIFNVLKDGAWIQRPRIYKPDGTQEDLADNITGLAILNQLGADGWEMVATAPWTAGIFSSTLENGSVLQSAEPMSRVYWLKRPVLAKI